MAVYTQEAVDIIERNPALIAQMQSDPVKTLKELAGPIPDTRVYRMIVFFLGLASILGILGGLVFGYTGKQLPAFIIAVCSATAGSLGALVSKQPK